MCAGAGAATGEVKAFAQHLKSVNRTAVGEREREKKKGEGCGALRSVLRSGNNCQMPDNVYQVLRSLYPVITLLLCKEENKVKKEKTKKHKISLEYKLNNSLNTYLKCTFRIFLNYYLENFAHLDFGA